jgi:hypothetical protein
MKRFVVLVALVLLALCGTSYATDRVAAPQMEPATATIAPVFDRELAIKAGIDNTINSEVAVLSTDAKPMMSEDIAGKWGLVTMISLAGVNKNLFLRPVTPCRIVDTRVDGGPFTDGEVRKYLLPGGVRCGGAIPQGVTYPSAEGVVALLEVNFEADNYPWGWGDNGPTFDFIGQPYSPDWFTMQGQRAFLFATNEGQFPNTAIGKIRGFVALKSFPGPFTQYWGLEAKVSSMWQRSDFRAHVTIDIVGYAVPTFTR